VLAILAGIYQTKATTVFPIATNPSLIEVSGGIARSGSNYLVSILSSTNVCTRLVSTNGILIGPLTTNGFSTGSAQIAGSSVPVFPFVAYGGANYLQVWYDALATNAFGRIISPSGIPIAPQFSVASSTNIVPMALTSDGTNFLVVLEDNNRNLYGQFVTSAGVLSNPAFQISLQGGASKSAAAAFGKTNYCVIWLSGGNNNNLAVGAMVSPSRSVSGPIPIGQTPAPDYSFEAVAFDGSNYLATWAWDPYPETGGNVTNWEIFGRLVSQAGTNFGNELQLVTDPGDDIIPSLAFDGSNYLLAWGYGANVITNTNIRFRYFNLAASAIGPEFTWFTAQGTNPPLLAINGLVFDGTRYAIAATLGTFSGGFSSGQVYGGFLPRLSMLTASNYVDSQFSLTLSETPGFNYLVQVNTNLMSTNWTTIVTNLATNGVFNFTDQHATNQSRFYRAMVQ
jgi:hypothetical protein